MKKIILTTIFLLVSNAVSAAAITSMSLTGGNFNMSAGTSPNVRVIMPGEFAGDLNIGGYIGGERIATDLAVNSIGYSQNDLFAGLSMLFSTRPSDDYNSGFRPLSGDITNGVLTLDLDSWTIWYAGTFINMGASKRCAFSITVFPTCSSGNAVTTYDAATGAYTADWSAVFSNETPFHSDIGFYGNWHIEGYVSAVPVPAAVWLLGSGLVALFGIARRKA